MFMRKKRLSNFIKNGNKNKGIRAIVRLERFRPSCYLFSRW